MYTSVSYFLDGINWSKRGLPGKLMGTDWNQNWNSAPPASQIALSYRVSEQSFSQSFCMKQSFTLIRLSKNRK